MEFDFQSEQRGGGSGGPAANISITFSSSRSQAFHPIFSFAPTVSLEEELKQHLCFLFSSLLAHASPSPPTPDSLVRLV